MSFWSRLARDTKGASAIEYAMVASLIAVAILAAITGMGGKMSNQYNGIENKL